MPKQRGEKRKREDDDPEPPRRSSRRRKRTSYGEDFVEVWSPPKYAGKGPQPSTSTGTSSQEPEPPANSVTWPSDPEHYGRNFLQTIVSASILFVSGGHLMVSARRKRQSRSTCPLISIG